MISVADLPDIDSPETVRQLGADIKWIGSRSADLMGSATEIWSGLRNTYSAPEASKLHAAMRQPDEIASELQKSTSEAQKNLDDYADKLHDFEKRKESLKGEILAALADLSYAQSLPETVTKTDADGETHEEPNAEREAKIAEAEQELDRLAREVERLRDDLKAADSDLASRFFSAAQGNLNFATVLLALASPEAREAFARGVVDWTKDLLGLIQIFNGPFSGLGLPGIALNVGLNAWKNQDQILDANRSLQDYLSASPEKQKYMREQQLRNAMAWGRSKYIDFLYDPGHSLGYLAPDVLLSAVTGGSSGAARAAGSGTAKNLAEAGARAGTRDAAEAASSAAARAAGKPAARSGAGASGRTALKDVDDLVPGTTPHPNGGSRGTNSTSTVSPAIDVEVQNAASTPAEPPVAGANGVHTGAETVTAYDPPTPKPGNNPTLTLREQMDQAWRETEKPTQRLMTDLEYTNTRRRADLAARYEALGDPSTAAAVRYLYDADTFRNLHLAVLEDPTVLERVKPGSDGLSLSVNNSIAPPPETHYSDVTQYLVTDGPIEPLHGPVPPPEWSTSVAADSDLIPGASVIDEIGTRTRHGYLQWNHTVDAHIQRSFHNEDGKVLGQLDANGRANHAYSSDDPIRKDGDAGRNYVEKNGQISHTEEEVEAYTKEHGTTPPHDEAGHALPANLFPNIGAHNFTAQNSNLNRGSFKQFEDIARDILNHPEDTHVDYRMRAQLDESGRPEVYTGEITGRHNASGQEILRIKQEFVNAKGRQFSRNPKVLNALDQPDVRKRAIDALIDAIVNDEKS
ncbi:hypothetical protein [Dermabacter vaginalis]|uniref:Uncharacterized protein n=1 Tax=Dermabacter vaginalis TaxID=1630135 RepID=A0ABX6A1D6_9MICO|nr:hypothetical protein [Dermabacter vaginalis]QEU10945.1 hypothetical protein FOB48_00550 [Dermabacter vaginalis]